MFGPLGVGPLGVGPLGVEPLGVGPLGVGPLEVKHILYVGHLSTSIYILLLERYCCITLVGYKPSHSVL